MQGRSAQLAAHDLLEYRVTWCAVLAGEIVLSLGAPEVFNGVAHLVGQACDAWIGSRVNHLVQLRNGGVALSRGLHVRKCRATTFGADSKHGLRSDVA